MSKLMNDTVKLYHLREFKHFERAHEFITTNVWSEQEKGYPNHKIWAWALRRWGMKFSYLECELRDSNWEEYVKSRKS